MTGERDEFSDLFSSSEFDGTIEAAFLLKATGIPVASWSRNPVRQEVVSVMAATMWGSLDTMVRTLGGTGPRSVVLETEDRRILVTQVEPNWTLLLVASNSAGKRHLQQTAHQVLDRVARIRRESLTQRTVPGVLE